MYCECYNKGGICKDTCRCINCQNTKNHIRQNKPDGKVDQEKQKSEDSNKKSIKPKEKSCNCKKSFCLKKYCECYNANQGCNQSCKCQDCKNTGDRNSFGNDKPPINAILIQSSSYNIGLNKQLSEPLSQVNIFIDKRQQQNKINKRDKIDIQQIDTKLSQIFKRVPSEKYQSMLDFLSLYLS